MRVVRGDGNVPRSGAGGRRRQCRPRGWRNEYPTFFRNGQVGPHDLEGVPEILGRMKNSINVRQPRLALKAQFHDSSKPGRSEVPLRTAHETMLPAKWPSAKPQPVSPPSRSPRRCRPSGTCSTPVRRPRPPTPWLHRIRSNLGHPYMIETIDQGKYQ